MDSYQSCHQCPRRCGAARDRQEHGFCKETDALRMATACLHFGEEPLLTVFGGSGTLFITGCTLRCSFCQNYQISQQGMGATVSKDDFVAICLHLQQKGAENINIVTGSHHIPQVAAYIRAAKETGVHIPFAWNSSAYESVESLELLRGLVDIWLPDLKTLNPLMSKELFAAEDYPSVAKKAIRWMLSASSITIQTVSHGKTTKEKMLAGCIIRHLFLPGRMDDTRLVLDWLKKHADGTACISLMSQYSPVPFRGDGAELAWRQESMRSFQNRMVSPQEDDALRRYIDDYQFSYLFYQDLSDDDSWLPDFSLQQPFGNKLATPVWHWRQGML